MIWFKTLGIAALMGLVAACTSPQQQQQQVFSAPPPSDVQVQPLPPMTTATTRRSTRTTTASYSTPKIIGVAPSIDARMPATGPAPIPAELNKPVICDNPRCAPVRAVYVHGVASPVFVQPTTTEVVKKEKIDCARTPGCTRTTNPQTGMTTGKVDNGEFDPHEWLRSQKKP